MKSNRDLTNRLAFDNVAEQYESSRPQYPRELFSDLARFGNLGRDSTILEVGAGTGQASEDLCERFGTVTAIEPGPSLLKILKSKTRRHKNIDCKNILFEDFKVTEKFHCLFSANAFHWIDPAVAYSKAHAALVQGGVLALSWNFPRISEHAQRAVDELTIKFDSEHRFSVTPRSDEEYLKEIEAVMEQGARELLDSGFFEEPKEIRYPLSRTLTVSQYQDLVKSYANVASFEEGKKEEFGYALEELLKDRFSDGVDVSDFAILRLSHSLIVNG